MRITSVGQPGCAGALLLIATSLLTRNCCAWKPIASVGSIGGSGSTTTFSLKQSHPGAASSSRELAINTQATSYAQFDGAAASHKDDDVDDELLLARAAIGGSDTTATAAHPISFTDDLEDHYDSYSLEDSEKASPPLGFPRSPLYGGDRCSVKKFAFNQDGIVDYENDLPELDQFTLCFWMRFTNHSGDHVMLTYEAEKEPREIQIWVANAQNSSFLSMAIKGQQMYRLNYPLRLRQWHHMCSSWNGKTGEWQVWLKAERIGRGFHNSLVGHKIPANGKLRSGGASITGAVSQGLHFEVTLVQVYKVALSAGKAHRDHKHHHVHHFDHEGQEVSTTTRVPPMINRPQPMHNLLASGQIPTRVRINLANPPPPDVAQQQLQQQQQQQAITINTNFVNGQINAGSRLVAQQLLGLAPTAIRAPLPRRPIISSSTSTSAAGSQQPGQFQMLSNSANVQFIDETETRIQFKRQTDNKQKLKQKQKRSADSPRQKKLQKRGLVLLDDGSVVDDGLAASGSGGGGASDADSDAFEKYNGLADFGGQQFKQDLTMKMNLEEEVSTHDREPAEEEVRAVMGMCSSCDTEPFQGAIVFAWRQLREHMNNTLKGLSVGTCGSF